MPSSHVQKSRTLNTKSKSPDAYPTEGCTQKISETFSFPYDRNHRIAPFKAPSADEDHNGGDA